MPEVRPFHALHPDFASASDPASPSRRGWVRDPASALYLLRESFEAGGRGHVRRGIVAALGLSPAAGSGLLPHEPSSAGLVRAWLEQLATSRAWAHPLLVLYPGDLGDLESRLALERERRPDARTAGADGARVELWRLEDPRAVAAVAGALAPRRMYLADGQNRHDAGLAWARRCEAAGARSGPHRYGLACLVSLDDPGLLPRPVHRIVRRVRITDPERLSVLLDEHFEVEVLAEDLDRPAGLQWAQRRLAEAGRVGHALLLLTRSDRRARLLRLREGVDLAHVAAMPRSPSLRAVDVTLLHALVLQHTLGLAPQAQVPEVVELTARAQDVVSAVLGDGGADLGALLNPAPLWLMRSVADAGELLPPGTTRFEPAVPSGVLASTVDPSEEL